MKDLFLKLNLQFFAEGEPNGDTKVDEPKDPKDQTHLDDPTGLDETPQEEPTLKQSDVNNLIAKETKKAQEKLLKQLGVEDFNNAKEGLAKLKEWQDSQKTEAQKQAEQLEATNKALQEAAQAKQELEYKLAALEVGVNKDSLEDALVLAQRYVNDETDITTALTKVVEKYPHFGATKQESPKPNFASGQYTPPADLGGGNPFAAKIAKWKK